ncbi:Hsp70 family protein [Polymorphum gilvum]|uniref:Putative chaperone protein DnaK-like protein n=1 Tax=Polymorphum gilvum (strain LMG 25793 / CGMCC 1.9160 / SL003B-26A1) TaxID=991905 RepID=F2J5E3_POLGS|nr:Hsp70 family protein [Polymorphum gilvum]ADZ72313.1 Putative chaperone protein DnaK-like protein [Polymorphum gilvum SL003B-26A1]
MRPAIGLDFGTSNTVVTACDSAGTAMTCRFGQGPEAVTSLPSVLCFLEPEASGGMPRAEVGPWAIRQFVESTGECRFLQSLKTFVASRLFKGTGVFGRHHDFEDLMEAFLRRASARCERPLGDGNCRLVIGRPVTFAGSAPDDGLAMERYRRALSRFGFQDVFFVYEPVAAAFAFAQRLDADATVLVADFGGGTTDFSVMRFSREGARLQASPLGHGGIGIAGNTLDYRIVDRVILPHLGKGSRYRSMGKELDVPPNLFSNFAHWHMLSVFKTSADYRELKKMLRACLEPEKIELFIDLVETDQGYPLYKAVSDAKMRLSSESETELRFAPLGAAFSARIGRTDFEAWIADDLDRVAGALDRTLADASVRDTDVDRVFLTGGTSFVPAIRRLFEARFGPARLSGGDELSSVAKGLALIGQRDDAADWSV